MSILPDGIILAEDVKKNMIIRFTFSILLASLFNLGFAQEDNDKLVDAKKPKKETKFTDVVNFDSIPASELIKRGVKWVKKENPKFDKLNGVNTSKKVECTVAFFIKPKQLNPECDYTGNITMKVVIECKDAKYRYTVSDITHVSKSGKTSGGSIDNTVPECGSMIMNDNIWKKLRGQAIGMANVVIEDLRDTMVRESDEPSEDEW